MIVRYLPSKDGWPDLGTRLDASLPRGRLPLWVRLRPRRAQARGLLCPCERTSSAWLGTSVKCHNRTFSRRPVKRGLLFGNLRSKVLPRYFPIDVGVNFDCVQSDLLTIRWRTDSLSADFILPGADKRALRVCFNGATIVRLLDEMPLSTEQGTKNEGLVSRHFAYRVEGSTFADTQSEAWRLSLIHI